MGESNARDRDRHEDMGGVKVVASVGVGVNTAAASIADVLTAAAALDASAADHASVRDDDDDGDGRNAKVSVAARSLQAATTETTTLVATAAEASSAMERASADAETAMADAVNEKAVDKPHPTAKCTGVTTTDSPAKTDKNGRVQKRKAKQLAVSHAHTNGAIVAIVANGKRDVAPAHDGKQEQNGVETEPPRGESATTSTTSKAMGQHVIDVEAEVDTESDSVAVAPVLLPSSFADADTSESKKRSRSPDMAKDDDDELAGVTSVEDPHSPEVICLDSDDHKDETQGDGEDEQDEDEDDDVKSEMGVTEDVDAETTRGPGRPSHRRKKRARVLGFSNNRSRKENKHKRQSLSIVPEDAPVVAAADGADASSLVIRAPTSGRGRPRRQQAADDAKGSTVQPATSSSDAVAWNWDSCRLYFEPLVQSNMDELATVRRDCGRIVAANSHMWGSIRRLEHDDAYLASLANDVDANEDVDHARIPRTRRGRSFRDAWEEEDFVASQQRAARSGKKRPFAGCESITNNRELVRGYDDDLFSAFTKLLETRVGGGQQSPQNVPDANGEMEPPQRIEALPTRRVKNAKRRPVETDKSTLPTVPVRHLHPASFGAWKLKGKDTPSFDVLHPAAIRSVKTPQRWAEELAPEQLSSDEVSNPGPRRSGRHDTKAQDDTVGGDQEDDGEAEVKFDVDVSTREEAIPLPSFGVVIEDDEISQEINNSSMRLVEVSALNWRRSQTLYERAVSYIEVTPLLQAEEAASQRIEHLHRTLYPPNASPDDEVDDFAREFKIWRRPKDLLSFVAKSSTVMTESLAIRAAVEFAWRLKIADSIDVLDRNGCWNDGVVVDIYADAGGEIKNVLVSFALWGADSSEWVPVVEARILPRGVADGRVTFVLGPNRTRKRHVELNKEVADFLQSSYPTRQKALQKVFRHSVDNDPDSDSTIKPTGKKQRRK